MPMRSTIAAAAALVGAATPQSAALALWDEKLELFAVETITRDDNVFRLARGVDPVAALGTASKGDTYRTTSAGLTFDIPKSEQRFVGDVTFSRYQFNRFGALDLDGHSSRTEWLWKAGDVVGGQLGYAQTLSLASLSNVQSGVQSTSPNFVKAKRLYLSTAFELTPRWQLRAELSELDQTNSAAEYLLSDLRSGSTGLELVYVTPAETRIGLGLRVVDGDLPNPQIFASALAVDNSYEQRSLAAFIEWQPSAHSRMSVRTGPLRRGHAELPERDFNGWIYQAGMEWKPTDRLTLTAAAQKDISATEEVNVGFVLVESVGLYSHLSMSDKVELALDLEHSDRDYRGEPAAVLGLVPARTERVRQLGFRVTFRPATILSLDFGLRRERRSSSVAFGSYAVGIASVSARVAF